MFTHVTMPDIIRPFVKQVEGVKGHYYQVDDGDIYPSITTVQHSFPNPGIESWKRREPNWEAISNSSMEVGTALHEIAEYDLNNKKHDGFGEKVFEKDPFELFNEALKPHLDEHVNNIYATETKLYSKTLQLAGTVDCVAEYDGVLSVIDFKNSRRPKTPSNLRDSGYYEQATAYAEMWKFCTEIEVKQAVILVCSWDNKCRAFKVNPKDYINSLWDILIRYEATKDL